MRVSVNLIVAVAVGVEAAGGSDKSDSRGRRERCGGEKIGVYNDPDLINSESLKRNQL